MRTTILFFALAAVATGCAASSNDAASGDQAFSGGSAATFALTADHEENLSGSASVGQPIEIDYALDRLSQCRGNVGGGGPGWSITGFYSENGGPAKTFEVSKVTADGKDRVAVPAHITPTQNGDLALWFQVTSVFGCSNYDSSLGANYHIQVGGHAPAALATITFDENGSPSLSGSLHAGGKVAVHYDPARLSTCQQFQGGYPQYGIGGYASINGGAAQSFETGHAEDGKLVATDAVINLPASGDLALWFDTTSVSGCHEYDSANGANYHFPIN